VIQRRRVQQSSDQNSIIVSHVLKNDPKIESVRFPEHTNKKRERERERNKEKKKKGR
jgi:O-acetylhomoserine/O-acetylserine sulfhydrylase-like pyridoxal-dependent enzyme